MDKEEQRIYSEVDSEATHQRALEICDLYADGVPLEQAIKVCGLTKRSFFGAKRTHPDVCKGFIDAKEVTAEFRLEDLDQLTALFKNGGIDKDTYKAVVDTEKWIITKLRPDLFGVRSTVSVSGLINHAPAQVLQSLSDEQILKLVDQSVHAADSFQKPIDTTPEDADYVELPSVNSTEEDPYIIVDTPDEVSKEPLLRETAINKSIDEHKKYLDLVRDADYIEEVEGHNRVFTEENVHNPVNNPKRPLPDSDATLFPIVDSASESDKLLEPTSVFDLFNLGDLR